MNTLHNFSVLLVLLISAQSHAKDTEKEPEPKQPTDGYCDGCKAIAHIFHVSFVSQQDGSRVPDIEKMVRELRYACTEDDNFASYHVVKINDEVLLSGPGIMKMGKRGVELLGRGGWPEKLQKLCKEIRDAEGDDEIYDAYVKSAQLKDFTEWLCEKKHCNKEQDSKTDAKEEL